MGKSNKATRSGKRVGHTARKTSTAHPAASADPARRVTAVMSAAERSGLIGDKTARIGGRVSPELVRRSAWPRSAVREIIAGFQGMVRRRALAELDTWLARARPSLVASFANGVTKDYAAVQAAISSPWSNGQTEGQITKLKLVKRQMYGRGKIDLLQARVVGAG